MIGKLTGLFDSASENTIVLDVNGVGYVVQLGARTLNHLPRPGSRISLYTETQIREDEIRLFGFESEAERQWFRTLQTVQGVGAKAALALIGALTPAELADAVVFQDKAAIRRAPGIGDKLAQRILSELKDKAPKGAVIETLRPKTAPQERRALHDALSALVNLGYSEADAARALASISAQHESAGIEALIRAGLKELAS